MVAPAINAALLAAAHQQALLATAITDQLKKAGAISPGTSAALDLSLKGSGTLLEQLVERGHVRVGGDGRYWLDQEAIRQARAKGLRLGLIAAAFLLSVAASLVAVLVSR